MRITGPMDFASWILPALLLVVPLGLGCSKADPASDPIPQGIDQAADQQVDRGATSTPARQPDLAAQPDQAETLPAFPGSDATAGSDGVATPPATTPDDAAVAEPVEEVERPKSLFRSIGRALRKGATDAVTSGDPAEDQPVAGDDP